MPASSAHPGPHPRLVLTPGLRVVACGRSLVQIGYDEAVRIRLPQDAATTRVLRALSDVTADLPDSPADRVVLARLEEAGCLRDLSELDRLRRHRDELRVSVHGDLGVDAAPLLAGAGLRVSSGDDTASVALLCGTAGIEHDLVDRLLRAEIPHLCCHIVDGVVRLGPFVVPGQTACVHCIDLHHQVSDPFRSLLGQRYSRALAEPRGDGLPDPDTTALATLALAFAARDLATWADGGTPWTWSATLRLGPEARHRSHQAWLRHPDCGCSWWAGQGVSGTMGA